MRKKILIAEHEVAVSDSLERRLQMRGYTPMVCGDAGTALSTFDAHRPDLVIISLTLPGDAGREVCRGIRMRPLGALVPILFLGTGREEVRNVSEAIAAGADHFFRKPDALADLLAKVATYIGPGEEGPAGPEPPHAPVADERELLAALGRTDSPALAPSAEAASSGFFRAIRDVLASRATPAPPSAVPAESMGRPGASPPPLPPDATQVQHPPAGAQPTDTDWAALDSLLHGAPVPAPVAAVPSGDADFMRTAAAAMTGVGALPLSFTPAAPPAPAAPAPREADPEPEPAPDPALERWTVGRRWTDRIDPLAHPDEAAVVPEPLTLPEMERPVLEPVPPPQAPAPVTVPAFELPRAPEPPAPAPAFEPLFEPMPTPAPRPRQTLLPAQLAVMASPDPEPAPPPTQPANPRQTLGPGRLPVQSAPVPATSPRETLGPGRLPVQAPTASPRQTLQPAQMPVMAPAGWDAPPLDLESPPPAEGPDAWGRPEVGARPAAVVTGGLAFAPPRRPAHDPADALTAMLDAGRATELERRGIGELLAAVAESGIAGRIEVASGGVLRRVFVDGGAPVYADSSEPGEDLVAFLAGEGRLTRAVMAEARDRAQVTGASAEEILIEAGYLQPEDVYRSLRAYVVERVLGLFAIEAGEATVIRGGPRPLDPVDLGMHPGRLVLDGIRRKYGRLRLYRAFGTPATVPRPRTTSRPELPGLVLRHDEASVLGLIDGRRTALEIARTAQIHEVDALAILFAFGVLQLIDSPVGIRPTQGLPSLDAESLLRAGAPRTDDQMPGFAELLNNKYSEIQAADYHQILGVPRAATGAEIRSAWERLKRQFDPHRVRRDGPHWQHVKEIANVLDDAFAVLGNERLRARYEAHLE